MFKQYQESDINDNTKIIRFLDLTGAEKSIGIAAHNEIYCTHHYGLLKSYKILETNAGDPKEGSTLINLGNGILGSDATINNALVSCWSIWDEASDPWLSFKDSSFSKQPHNICVIVSTIGKVSKIFQQTIEISRLMFGDNITDIIHCHVDRPVIYYPREHGLNQDHWREITDVKNGLAARPIHNIFHKRDSNQKGQRYDAEFEYRFAIILGMRRFFGNNTNIAISAQDMILRDYPLILCDGKHYIEKVYLQIPHPVIEATCWNTGVDLIKLYQNVAV